MLTEVSPISVEPRGWERTPCKAWKAIMAQDASAEQREKRADSAVATLNGYLACPKHKGPFVCLFFCFGKDRTVSCSTLGEASSLGGCGGQQRVRPLSRCPVVNQ